MEAHFYQAVPNPTKFNPALSAKLSQIVVRMVEKSASKRFADWESIEKLLDVAGTPTEGTAANPVVDAMIKRRLEADTAAQALQAEESRREQDRHDFCKLVLSQFQQTVVTPIRSLVDDFNRDYAGPKVSFSEQGITIGQAMMQITKDATIQVRFPSGQSVSVRFRVCMKEDFVREVFHNEDGLPFRHKKVILPQLKEQRVMGWGFVKASNGKGFNIVLIEQQGDLYGRFVFLVNRMGFPADVEQRPEPFPFDFEELEREIQFIEAYHIYSTKTEEFSEAFLTNFVSEYA